MVRFHWMCEGSQGSFVPPRGVTADEAAGVTHVAVEMELAGQHETCPALLTLPAAHLEEGGVRELGILLAHGADGDAWRGPLLEALAARLAARGHVVGRYLCRQKEMRRQRIFERTADTAAAAPHARAVRRWVWVGLGNGARIAALVAAKAPRLRGRLAGAALLSYPLAEPAPPPPKTKTADVPRDSTGPLLRLAAACPALPLLLVSGELDYNCPGADLKAIAPRLAAEGAAGARAVILDDLDADFRLSGADAPTAEAVERVAALVERFVAAVAAGDAGAAATAGGAPLEAIVPSARVPPRPAAPEPEEEEPEPLAPPPPPPPPPHAPGAAPVAPPGINPALFHQFLAARAAAAGGMGMAMPGLPGMAGGMPLPGMPGGPALSPQQQAALQAGLQQMMLQQQAFAMMAQAHAQAAAAQRAQQRP
jgi:hypothetical protein